MNLTGKRPAAAMLATAVLLAMALGGCSRDPEKMKQKYLRSGEQFMQKQKYREASIEFRNALKVDPKFVEAFFQLAKAREALRQWNDVYAALQQAKELDPRRTDVRLDLARLYLAAAKYKEAEEEATYILSVDAKNAAAYQVLGASFLARQDFADARGPFETITELLPKDPASYANLALVEVSLRRFDDAEKHFQKATEVDSHYVQGHMNLAGFYQLRGHPEKAVQALEKAIEQNPDKSALYVALADVDQTQAKPDAAAAVLDRLRQRDPKSADVAQDIGDSYAAHGQIDKALAEYQRGLGLDAKRTDLKQRMVEVYLDTGRVQDADTLNNEILKGRPKDMRARVARGRILLAEGRPDDSIAALRQQVTDTPDSPDARYFLAVAYMRNGQMQEAKNEFQEALRTEPKMTGALENLAEVSWSLGDAAVAQEYAQRAVQSGPADPMTHLELGSIYLKQGQVDKAREQLLDADRLKPNDAQIQLNLAQAAAAAHQWVEADRGFERALTLNPQSTEALAYWAQSLLARKDPVKTLAIINRHIASYPGDASGYDLRGEFHFEQKQYDAAEADLLKAIQLNPNLFVAYLRLGKLYQEKGNLDAAIQRYEKAISIQPKFVPIIALVGNLYMDKGDFPTARKYYEQALAINPDFAVAASNLAWVYAMTGGNLDVALGLAQKAKSLMPDLDSITDTLGWVEYKRGSYPSAIPLFQECVRRVPNSGLYRYHLGLALLATGERQKAKESLQMALRMDLKGDDAREARETLTRIAKLE